MSKYAQFILVVATMPRGTSSYRNSPCGLFLVWLKARYPEIKDLSVEEQRTLARTRWNVEEEATKAWFSEWSRRVRRSAAPRAVRQTLEELLQEAASAVTGHPPDRWESRHL